MAEYQNNQPAIRAAGAEIVALSVDSMQRSEGLRTDLALSFPILCDTSRVVVREWCLYNPNEMGGIAVPAVFVIGADLRIRYRSVDSTRQRVHTDGVLSYLLDDSGAGSIKREPVRAGIREFARATMNAIRRGLRTPHD